MYVIKVGNYSQINELRQKYFMSNKENTDLYITTLAVSQPIRKNDKATEYISNLILAVVNNQLQIVDYVILADYFVFDEFWVLTEQSSYDTLFKYATIFKINYDIPVDHLIPTHEYLWNHVIITWNPETEDEYIKDLIDEDYFLRIETINFYQHIFNFDVKPFADILKPSKKEVKDIKIMYEHTEKWLTGIILIIWQTETGNIFGLYEIYVTYDGEEKVGRAVIYWQWIDKSWHKRTTADKLIYLDTLEYNLKDIKDISLLSEKEIIDTLLELVVEDSILWKN